MPRHEPTIRILHDEGGLEVQGWFPAPPGIEHPRLARLHGPWQTKYAKVLERHRVTRLAYDASALIKVTGSKFRRGDLLRAHDLSFVEDLSGVSSLLVRFRTGADLSPLSRMSNLNSLDLDFWSDAKVRLALDTLPHLKELRTVWSPGFTGWEAQRGLQSLKLTYLRKVSHLDLSWAVRLRELTIWHAGSLVDIVGPQLNRTLSSLDIAFAPRFERIGWSRRNTSVKKLGLVAVGSISKDFLKLLTGVRYVCLGTKTPPLYEFLGAKPKGIMRMPV